MKSKITATEIAADIIRWSEAREEEIEQERKRNDELATKLVLLQEQYLNLQVGIEDEQSDNESSQSEPANVSPPVLSSLVSADELLRQVYHTLYWHGHIDKDTDLYKRIETFFESVPVEEEKKSTI